MALRQQQAIAAHDSTRSEMIGMVKKLFILLVAASCAVMQSTVASEPGDDAGKAALSPAEELFLTGNVLFALLHEAGHAIVDEFDVPILGLEENAADTIAIVSLILLDRDRQDARYSAAIGVTALVQSFVWQSGVEREYASTLLWAQHGLSAQRFARMVCLLYGSDSERFAWVAEAAEMDEIRTDGCEHEWETAERGYLWLFDTFGVPPEERAANTGERNTIKYGPARDAEETMLLELLQNKGVLPNLAQALESRFEFADSLTLRLTHCGVPNAYWDSDYAEIVLCYELMTAGLAHVERPEVARLVEQFYGGGQQSAE